MTDASNAHGAFNAAAVRPAGARCSILTLIATRRTPLRMCSFPAGFDLKLRGFEAKTLDNIIILEP